MIDFKVFHCKASDLFNSAGVLDSEVLIEEGCWYLCTDTAELFLGTKLDNGEIVLKRINTAINSFNSSIATRVPASSKGEELAPVDVLGAYIDEATRELRVVFSDGTERALDNALDTEGKLSFATKAFVKDQIDAIQFPETDLSGHATKQDLEETKRSIPTKVSELTNDSKFITLEQVPEVDLSNYVVKETLESYAQTDAVQSALQMHLQEAGSNYAQKVELAYYAKLENLAAYVTNDALDKKGYLTAQDIADKADSNHAHDDRYDPKGDADKALASAKSYTDELVEAAKSEIKDELLAGAVDAHSTLKKLGDLIDANQADISALETLMSGKADMEHSHEEYLTTIPENYVTTDILEATIKEIELTPGPQGPAFTYNDFTEEQLLALKGKDGKDGTDGKDGKDGKDGIAGKSAFEIWQGLDNTGTEQDFISSLKGLDGKDGTDGKDGKDGTNGTNGNDGLTTAIKIGETTYSHTNGTIELPDTLFSTKVGRSFTTDITLGHLESGTEITSNMTFGEILYRILYQEHEHNYTEEVTEPTCTEPGTKTFTCTDCNEVYTETVPALGHNWSDWTVETEADCTNTGTKKRTCNRCNIEEIETIAALGHKAGDVVVENEVPATCTVDGSYDEVVYCTVEGCGEELSRETKTVAALGHDYGDWEITKDPEVGVEGEKQKTCFICGDVVTETIPALEPEEPVNTYYYLGSIGIHNIENPAWWPEWEADYGFDADARAQYYLENLRSGDVREIPIDGLAGDLQLTWSLPIKEGRDEVLSELYEEDIEVNSDSYIYPAIAVPSNYKVTEWATDANYMNPIIDTISSIETNDGYTIYYALNANKPGNSTPYYIKIESRQEN